MQTVRKFYRHFPTVLKSRPHPTLGLLPSKNRFYPRNNFLIILQRLYSKGEQGEAKNMSGTDTTEVAASHQMFTTKDLSSLHPVDEFDAWYKLAKETPGTERVNAMALGTATKCGRPAVRAVILRGFDKTSFKFITDYSSRKAKELDENPYASLMLYWAQIDRMVRIEGRVERLTEEESSEYFYSRPRLSQLSTMVCPMGTVIESQEVLVKRFEELKKEYEDTSVKIPRLESWGGYKVLPDAFEFYKGGPADGLPEHARFRRQQEGEVLDDRLSHKVDDGWILERLN